MTYGSVCSGIEAATVAWGPLDWQPAWFAEIEPFPSAVLAHHFPEVRNLGDFTKIGSRVGPIDLLIGGTPCQSFSVAGLRGGLTDARGNLALEFLRLAGRLRPRWLVWENVPGVLSSAGGRDFAAFISGLVELGYGWAYRVLDAQYFGVPQRRRRVFVVGHLGAWQPAAAVLFEPASLSGHPAPGRASREEVAGCLGGGSGERGWAPDTDRMTFVPDVSRCVSTRGGRRLDSEMEQFIVGTLNANGKAAGSAIQQDAESGLLVAHSLRGDGFDASEDGTGRGVPLVIGGGSWPTHGEMSPALTGRRGDQTAVAFSCKDHGADAGDVAPTMRGMGHDGGHANGGGQLAVAFNLRGRDGGAMPEASEMASVRAASGGSSRSYVATFDERSITSPGNRSRVVEGEPCHSLHADAPAIIGAGVRRLTPVECERLQGFPDGWTGVPYRGKPAADGPRYRAIGNSMAVPVVRWIGERIALADAAEKIAAAEVTA